jgi:hypothetical protein
MHPVCMLTGWRKENLLLQVLLLLVLRLQEDRERRARLMRRKIDSIRFTVQVLVFRRERRMKTFRLETLQGLLQLHYHPKTLPRPEPALEEF